MSETTKFATGAVRSADANHLSFTSLPLLGLLGVARTSAEGRAKYGSHNYMKGMPVHDLLEHVFRHYILFLLGDRSEPHLEHAAWGALAAVQSYALDPELSAAFLLGPGATLSDALRARLDAEAPDLGARRAAGEFDGLGEWRLSELPEVARILEQRRKAADFRTNIDRMLAISREEAGTIPLDPIPADPFSTAEFPAIRADDTPETIAARLGAAGIDLFAPGAK